MRWSDQVRSWRQVGLCGLLGIALHSFATARTEAQTETSTPSQKTAQTSTTSSTGARHSPNNTKRPSSAHKTIKHTSAPAGTHPSSAKGKSAHGKKGSKQVARKRGQQAIDSDRARQIQTALIREHYMQGEPTGQWDSTTQAAMQKFQADQGWQSKTTPDSRALIKLGLGPSPDHLLNPESAMTMPAAAPAASEAKSQVKPSSPENKVPNR
jgi:peptidoglycan hydrolase-like protein with peptidoglycan-binding domain